MGLNPLLREEHGGKMPTESSRRFVKPLRGKTSGGREWLAAFSPRRLYQDLCFSFRKDRNQLSKGKCKGPLKLSEAQFEGAKDEFVAREVSRFSRRTRQEYPKRQKAPVVWRDVDWSTIGPRLEHLRLQMYFARTTEQYKAASRDFDRIIRKLKPPQRKEHAIKRDPLQFLTYLTERYFLWIVLKGEYKAGMAINNLQRQYAYCQNVPWDTLKERLTQSPKQNAFLDMSDRYTLAADSIPILLSPSRWFED